MVIRIVGTVVAFLSGALAWVLPPHALGRIVDHYPHTTWAWLGDALWNIVPTASIPITIVIGLAYGLLDPRFWYISFLATWWVVPFNIALDVTNAPTSHNLLPFELLAFAIVNIPTLVAARIGKFARLRNRQQQKQ